MIRCANKKLKINGSSLVLEEDGTPIDEDDILKCFMEKILILLQDGECWIEKDEVQSISMPNGQKDESCRLNVSLHEPTGNANKVPLLLLKNLQKF